MDAFTQSCVFDVHLGCPETYRRLDASHATASRAPILKLGRPPLCAASLTAGHVQPLHFLAAASKMPCAAPEPRTAAGVGLDQKLAIQGAGRFAK